MIRKVFTALLVTAGLAETGFSRDLLPARWFEDIPASDDSVQRSFVFRTIPGVVYQVETSHDLSTWASGPEIYGLGHEHIVPLLEVTAPPPPDPSNPPVLFVPFKTVGLRIQPESGTTDGIILSWPSLDHGGSMIYRVPGTLHQAWTEAFLFAQRYDDYYFFIHHPLNSAPAPIQNTVLGSIDSEMIATFEAHLADMNLLVAASQARARATPDPAPPSPDARLFVRVSADWSRDTDGDGSPDWIEEAIAADASHPQHALANTFSADTDVNGAADGSQIDFDEDGTPDILDAAISDSAIYWEKGPVPRYAVFPLPNYQGDDGIEVPWQITNSNAVLYTDDVWQNGAFAKIDRVGTDGAYTDPLAINARGQLVGTNNVSSPPAGSSGPNLASLVWWPSTEEEPRPLLSEEDGFTYYAATYPGVHWLTDDGVFVANVVKKGPGESIEYLGDHFWTLPESGYVATRTPAPPNLAGAIDREYYWTHATAFNQKTTAFTTPSGQETLSQHISNFVPLPGGGFAAISEKLQIKGPSSEGLWLDSVEIPKAKAMSSQGWAVVSNHTTQPPSGQPGFGDVIWANGKFESLADVAPGLPTAWTGNPHLDEMTRSGTILISKESAPLNSAWDFAQGLPISIEDDLFATGVDNVSITSSIPGPECGGRDWVMVPRGWTNSFDLILNGSSSYQAPATNHQGSCESPVSLGNNTTNVTLSGEAEGESEDRDLQLRIGVNDSISNPIGVKVMNERTVNIKVWYVSCSSSAYNKPTKQEIENFLYARFRLQLNAHIHCGTPTDLGVIDFNNKSATDLGAPPGDSYDGELNFDFGPEFSGEAGQILKPSENGPENNDSAASINVYLVGGVYQMALHSTNSGVYSRLNQLDGYTFIEEAVCWVNAGQHRSKTAILDTLAHEIGHVIIGSGHPDKGSGKAPLPGTNHRLRLMCSGDLSPSDGSGRLLVKAEWDAAEIWFKEEEDSGRIIR